MKNGIKNLGIVIIPNSPWKKEETLGIIWRKNEEKLKDQFGIVVKENDPLVQVRVFDMDKREKDTSLQDHRYEWLVQTHGKDKYDSMASRFPASLLKKYKQGDKMKLNYIPGKEEMELECSVKYIDFADTWEETLKKLGV